VSVFGNPTVIDRSTAAFDAAAIEIIGDERPRDAEEVRQASRSKMRSGELHCR